ncbi:nitroreductase family deazaflavin-dependent oxidoreductase [Microbacterium pumilum]
MNESNRTSGPPRWLVQGTAPFARALSGRRWFPLWAIVHHRGRRSGTRYSTPVAVVPTESQELILIGLPWGRNTNWARNVVAAGSATLTWKGREHQTTAPRVIEAAEAAALAKPFFRNVIRRFPAAIVLHRS